MQRGSGDERRIGRYVLRDRLGEGGMGAVYRAYDPALDREVALKIVLSAGSSEDLLRFKREAQAAARLDLPGVVRTYDTGIAEGRPFLVMELVPGGSLRDRLNGGWAPSTREAAELVAQLARTVARAHEAGVIHRDLKPENVLFAGDGRLLIADFGLAKIVGRTSRVTATGEVLGTPAYVAPEQITGEEAHPSFDIYALGVMLYELLTGFPPFRGDSYVAVLQSAVNEPARPPSESGVRVPSFLDKLALACLAKDPQDRPRSAAALAESLERFLADQPGRLPTALGRARRGRSVPAVLVAALTVLLSAGFAAALLGGLFDGQLELELSGVPGEEAPVWSSSLAVQAEARARGGWFSPERVNLEVRAGAGGEAFTVTPVPVGTPFEVTLPLLPGVNAYTLELFGGDGRPYPGTLRSLSVRYPVPKWWTEVEVKPPLPLPPGLRFGAQPGLYTWERDGTPLVWHPPGRFRDPRGREREVGGFFLGLTEVPISQYVQFLAETGRSHPLSWDLWQRAPSARLPAVGVTWLEAQAYADWVGLRLPTSDEWSYAARGGEESRRYPWGNQDRPAVLSPGAEELERMPSPVDQPVEPPARWGVWELGGNAAEWVFTAFPTEALDPKYQDFLGYGEPTLARVWRGGSWTLPGVLPSEERSTIRSPLGESRSGGVYPGDLRPVGQRRQLFGIGFRLALGILPTRRALLEPWQLTLIAWTPAELPVSDSWQERLPDFELLAAKGGGPPLGPVEVGHLDFRWLGRGPGLPDPTGRTLAPTLGSNEFLIRATTTATVPPGRWRLHTRSDDGIRVFMDGVEVLSDWTWHSERRRDYLFEVAEERKIELEVEYCDITGHASLAVEILPEPEAARVW